MAPTVLLMRSLEERLTEIIMDGTTDICRAIHDRRLLRFNHGGLERVVAPYCLGTSHLGNEVLRAVQVRGFSKKGGLGFGKLWTVSGIKNLLVLDEQFEPDDPHYNPDDSAMKFIHCRVQRRLRRRRRR
jgi:hypothetical protein